MSEHTPGPWMVSTDKRHTVKKRGEEPWDFQTFEIVAEGHFRVAAADFWSIGDDIAKCGYPRAARPEIAEANAHLIAAAPLLLEAAEAALAQLTAHGWDKNPCRCEGLDLPKCMFHTAEAIRTAINAAKGNQQ